MLGSCFLVKSENLNKSSPYHFILSSLNQQLRPFHLTVTYDLGVYDPEQNGSPFISFLLQSQIHSVLLYSLIKLKELI